MGADNSYEVIGKESIKIKMQNLSRMTIGIKIKKRPDNQFR